MKKYVVKPGDSLYQISQKTGVRIPLLMAANPQIQDPNQLMPGTTMVIPELGKPAKTGATQTTKPHKVPVSMASAKSKVPAAPYFGFVWPHQVQPGETWDGIASQYGVSPAHLQQVNPGLSQDLVPGSTVYVPTIPGAMPAPGMPTQPQMPAGGGMGSYGSPYPQMPSYPQQMGGMNMQDLYGMMPQGAPMTQEDVYGPHTHQPYRQEPEVRQDASSNGWYVGEQGFRDVFSDQDESMWRGEQGTSETRSVAKDEETLPTTDDDGWSSTFSIRLDEGQ